MGRQKSRRLNQRDVRAAKGVGLAKLGHLKHLPEKKEAWHVRAHAIKRAMERYGLRLSHRDIKKMSANIRGEKKDLDITLIERQSSTRSLYEIIWENVKMLVIYDKGVKSVSTLLPPDALELKMQEF